MTGSRGYQDAAFVVDEVAGRTVTRLEVLGDKDCEKVVLSTDDGARYEFYLDAFLGFWHTLDDEAYHSILEDYGGAIQDVQFAGDLVGQRILEATCVRSKAAGTRILLNFGSGVLRLRERDTNDPHSESLLDWIPA